MNLMVDGPIEAYVSDVTGSIIVRIGNDAFARGMLTMYKSEAIQLRDELLKVCPVEPAEA